MRTVRNVLVIAALCAVAPAQSNPNAAGEQRFFNLEDNVRNQVTLSDAELAALTNDSLMQKTLHPNPSAPKLTQEGIEATVVHLCGSSERDLLVIGNGEAFVGANLGPFWIIRSLPTGPTVVLSELSLALTIETKRSNKCLSVQAFAATATVGTTTDFTFNGEKYVVSRQKSQKL